MHIWRKYTIYNSADHDKIGEDFLLSLGYPTDVTKFVRGHVQVKNLNKFFYFSLGNSGMHIRL